MSAHKQDLNFTVTAVLISPSQDLLSVPPLSCTWRSQLPHSMEGSKPVSKVKLFRYLQQNRPEEEEDLVIQTLNV